jgi:hypothetical protein
MEGGIGLSQQTLSMAGSHVSEMGGLMRKPQTGSTEGNCPGLARAWTGAEQGEFETPLRQQVTWRVLRLLKSRLSPTAAARELEVGPKLPARRR